MGPPDDGPAGLGGLGRPASRGSRPVEVLEAQVVRDVVGEALEVGLPGQRVFRVGDEAPGRLVHQDLLDLGMDLEPLIVVERGEAVLDELVHLGIGVVAVVDVALLVEVEEGRVARIGRPRRFQVEDHRLLALGDILVVDAGRQLVELRVDADLPERRLVEQRDRLLGRVAGIVADGRLEAVLVPGLGQQLLGLLDVVAIVEEGLVGHRIDVGHRRLEGVGQPVIDRPNDLLARDRVVHRLPDFHIVEGRHLGVELEPDHVGGARGVVGGLGIALEALVLARLQELGDVDGAAGQQRKAAG